MGLLVEHFWNYYYGFILSSVSAISSKTTSSIGDPFFWSGITHSSILQNRKKQPERTFTTMVLLLLNYSSYCSSRIGFSCRGGCCILRNWEYPTWSVGRLWTNWFSWPLLLLLLLLLLLDSVHDPMHLLLSIAIALIGNNLLWQLFIWTSWSLASSI